MQVYLNKTTNVQATQYLKKATELHPALIQCTGGGNSWGQTNPLTEVPEGLEVLGFTTLAVKSPIRNTLMEVLDTDWIVFTQEGDVFVVPDTLFQLIYFK